MSFWRHPTVRSVAVQLLTVVAVVWFVVFVADNTIENMRSRNLAPGIGFLNDTAGFDILQSLIPYSRGSTYATAFLVGLLNTLLVAVLGIITATILGFIIGVMRLSRNWVVRQSATIYVELIRNIPLLLQMFVWYKTVLKALPAPRDSYQFSDMFFLSNRGLMSPKPMFEPAALWTLAALTAGIIATFFITRWARKRQEATGEIFPAFLTSLGLILALPVVVFVASGVPVEFELPVLQGFNFVGGLAIIPEFMALYLALSIYTAAFISEIVRAGVLSVSHGQTEAAHALGLRHGPTLRLIVIPQAMRVIIPPLASQYLNLTKNSSLAVAIGYPDFVYTGGTILNQTGQAVTIVLIWMAVYLSLSLLTSTFMNWFNSRMRLVER
ncbi:MAG: amino acid ABC transporter permease [Aestuariivirgaceae bacterium]|nr:amino acid ABC transporter permease [Aestuariivirgaceae bacterium]